MRFSFSGVAPLIPLQHIRKKEHKSGWWQLKYFFNFHPEPWGNDPIQFDLRIFSKKGLIQTTTEGATFFCFFIEALISTEAPHDDHPFHTQERITIGVADGVSSWQRYGVNPALFAWELMVRCEEVASSSGKLEAQIGDGFTKTRIGDVKMNQTKKWKRAVEMVRFTDVILV